MSIISELRKTIAELSKRLLRYERVNDISDDTNQSQQPQIGGWAASASATVTKSVSTSVSFSRFVSTLDSISI